MPAIEKALQLVDLIDDDTEYPPLLDYATKRTEADFDNEFIYSLLNEEAKQAIMNFSVEITEYLFPSPPVPSSSLNEN